MYLCLKRQYGLPFIALAVFVTFISIIFSQVDYTKIDSQPVDNNQKAFDSELLQSIICRTAFNPGPVQQDMISRGLASVELDKIGAIIGGTVDMGAIEQLVRQGTYWINQTGNLQLGPQLAQVSYSKALKGAYKYSQMLTRTLSLLDNYSFRGHSISVTIPAEINLKKDSKTVHNLYNTHLVLPNGKWVESGVGWVSWTVSPIIYTYESYTGHWSYASVPDGVQRDILLKIDIGTDYQAEMYVDDPYSGKSIRTYQKVDGLNHRVDQTQEQYSDYDVWLATPVATHYDSKLKNADDEWQNWDNSVNTAWVNNVPLYVTRDTNSSLASMQTWCQP